MAARARDIRWEHGEQLTNSSAAAICYVCGDTPTEWRHLKKSGGYAFICAVCHAGMGPD